MKKANKNSKIDEQQVMEEVPVLGDQVADIALETLAQPIVKNYTKKKPVVEEQIALQDKEQAGKVAILSEDGFEEVELTSPKQALEDAGFTVEVISSHDGKIKGWNETDWGKEINVDKTLHDARPYEYEALVLPGGVMNPDKLRQNKDAIVFVKQFINTGKPVAAICHGPQTLIETGLLQGMTMTSYPSLKTDLRNAGVKWVDKEMVHSGQFITSRKPADLESFNKELIHSLAPRWR